MFGIIKLIIWIAGICTIVYFGLRHFGYEINMNYFTESKEHCQQRVNDCAKQYMEQGTKNAKCDFNCMDPKFIIKKK
jgi:hypothetical protein